MLLRGGFRVVEEGEDDKIKFVVKRRVKCDVWVRVLGSFGGRDEGRNDIIR